MNLLECDSISLEFMGRACSLRNINHFTFGEFLCHISAKRLEMIKNSSSTHTIAMKQVNGIIRSFWLSIKVRAS